MTPIYRCLVPLLLFVQSFSRRVQKKAITTRAANRNSSGTVDLVQDLKRKTDADLVPCPFLAALYKKGLINPLEDGTWSKAEAYKALDIIVGPVKDVSAPKLFVLKQLITGAFFGISLPLLNDPENMRIPFNEWNRANLHKYHTGIRLAKVIGEEEDPMNWKKPCGKTLDGTTCGAPGVHPEVFDKLAEKVKKEENEVWTADDVVSLCETTKETFYGEACAKDDACYDEGGAKDACATLYGLAVQVFEPFGGLTKQQWKTFLAEATFPEVYEKSLPSTGEE